MKYNHLFLSVLLLCFILFIGFNLSIIPTEDLKNIDVNNLNNAQNKTLQYNRGEINKSQVEKSIRSKVNQKRLDKNLKTIESDSNLSEVARYKSRNMKRNNYLSHISPQGNSPLDRVNMYNIGHCKTVGENILKTKYKSPLRTSFNNSTIVIDSEERLSEVIFRGWINSKDHRSNILNENWKYQSSGISVDKNGTVYATQVFCR